MHLVHGGRNFFNQICGKTHFADHILRGQKFSGSAPRVHERLCRPAPLLQPLQLHPCGERLFHGVRQTPLPGPPVLPAPWRVFRQPAHDWNQ